MRSTFESLVQTRRCNFAKDSAGFVSGYETSSIHTREVCGPAIRAGCLVVSALAFGVCVSRWLSVRQRTQFERPEFLLGVPFPESSRGVPKRVSFTLSAIPLRLHSCRAPPTAARSRARSLSAASTPALLANRSRSFCSRTNRRPCGASLALSCLPVPPTPLLSSRRHSALGRSGCRFVRGMPIYLDSVQSWMDVCDPSLTVDAHSCELASRYLLIVRTSQSTGLRANRPVSRSPCSTTRRRLRRAARRRTGRSCSASPCLCRYSEYG